ncbi:protein-glutamate O-methyltransferase [Paracoccus nototheniae]|uniref:CheR family methyltransferase n=1 Tax=Paracoccus nototheniae TaxID=2489002 RepID=UPI001039186E|nr:protein-glutamate O-methyltransferase [Paracoccus nototheniae]
MSAATSVSGPTLSAPQFRKIADLLYHDSGIVLTEAKRSLLIARLNKRLRALNLADYGAYCSHLDGPDAATERRHLLSALTTNVTAFFRENHHFRSMAVDVLPPMIREARQGRRLRLWSAACSSGEEAYSIAITLLEAFPEAAQKDVLILATDIDPLMVERAKSGLYGADAMQPVPPALRDKYFATIDAGFEALPAMRRLMRFAELNLHHSWPFTGHFDVIFCRNAAIYFDGPARQRLWHHFGQALVPGGSLYIGHSERLDGSACPYFEIAGTTHYRRNDLPIPALPA